MIDFTGYGENLLTFKAAEGIKCDFPAQVTENDTVGNAADGVAFCGVVKSARAGIATVLMNGYAVLPYTGDAPSLGYGILAADGNGGVKTATKGRSVTVITVNTDKKTVGFIF